LSECARENRRGDSGCRNQPQDFAALELNLVAGPCLKDQPTSGDGGFIANGYFHSGPLSFAPSFHSLFEDFSGQGDIFFSDDLAAVEPSLNRTDDIY
jgi:hypothetical protein